MLHAEMDDKTLVRLAQQELPYRTAAFEQLMHRHGPRLRGLCRRMVSDRAEAEDLTQEVMLKIFFQIRLFRGEAAFTSWLWRITANQCMDHLRKLSTRLESGNEMPPDFSDDGLCKRQMHSAIDAERLLTSLDPEERLIVLLRLFADLNFDEVADIMKIGTSATKMRYQRALQRLCVSDT